MQAHWWKNDSCQVQARTGILPLCVLGVFFTPTSHAKSPKPMFGDLDGAAIRNANRGDSRESIRTNRFAEQLLFRNVRAIRANRLKPAIRKFLVPRNAIRKKGVQFGNPETIRENQAIRANLQIDSHESGHLSSAISMSFSPRFLSTFIRSK